MHQSKLLRVLLFVLKERFWTVKCAASVEGHESNGVQPNIPIKQYLEQHPVPGFDLLGAVHWTQRQQWTRACYVPSEILWPAQEASASVPTQPAKVGHDPVRRGPCDTCDATLY